MGRTMPTECPHGKILDWGDFAPGNSDDPDTWPPPEGCEVCEATRRVITIHIDPRLTAQQRFALADGVASFVMDSGKWLDTDVSSIGC